MTVDEVRKERENLQANIHFLLTQFKEETGVPVRGVTIEILNSTNVQCAYADYVVGRVIVDIAL